jgi:hypothetical protein
LITLGYILVALICGFFLGRYRAYVFQNRGEALVARTILGKFSGSDYHLMNNVTVRMEDGTTQIDHVLITRFGVIVIETKDYRGWIFGNARDPSWTQVIFRRKFRFQNPIRQNFRHVRAVQNLLDFLPADAVVSAVVFTGEAEFRTPIPPGVFCLESFCEYLSNLDTQLLSQNRLEFCVGRLEANRFALTRMTDVKHVQDLQRRHGDFD